MFFIWSSGFYSIVGVFVVLYYLYICQKRIFQVLFRFGVVLVIYFNKFRGVFDVFSLRSIGLENIEVRICWGTGCEVGRGEKNFLVVWRQVGFCTGRSLVSFRVRGLAFSRVWNFYSGQVIGGDGFMVFMSFLKGFEILEY